MPTVSIELASGINPYRDTRPYVGLTPTIPQKAAGSRTEPPVSEPRALKKCHTNILIIHSSINQSIYPSIHSTYLSIHIYIIHL